MGGQWFLDQRYTAPRSGAGWSHFMSNGTTVKRHSAITIRLVEQIKFQTAHVSGLKSRHIHITLRHIYARSCHISDSLFRYYFKYVCCLVLT